MFSLKIRLIDFFRGDGVSTSRSKRKKFVLSAIMFKV